MLYESPCKENEKASYRKYLQTMYLTKDPQNLTVNKQANYKMGKRFNFSPKWIYRWQISTWEDVKVISH